MTDVNPIGNAGRLVWSQCGLGGDRPDLQCIGEGGWVLPASFLAYRETIRNMEVRPSDVWMLGFPKSGTTWSQEMVWVLSNNCDIKAATESMMEARFPVLESVAMGIPEALLTKPLSKIDKLPRGEQRFIKSHLAVEFLPKGLLDAGGPKIVYVSRDPRDVLISLYHNYRTIGLYRGTLDEYLDAFVADEVVYAPVMKHVEVHRKLLQGNPNVLWLTYEEMKKDLRSVLRRTAKFLDANSPAPGSPEEDAVLDHLHFKSMKVNSSVNNERFLKMLPKAIRTQKHLTEADASDGEFPDTERNPDDDFIRRGETGGWRKELNERQAQVISEWYRKRSS